MKYFKQWELKCRCGCGLYNITEEMEETLDAVRELAGVPMVVNSGCRCEEHNRDVKGSPTSSHLKGIAVDIKADNNADRDAILYALYKLNIRRVGIAKSFIHFDIDYSKTRERCWVY